MQLSDPPAAGRRRAAVPRAAGLGAALVLGLVALVVALVLGVSVGSRGVGPGDTWHALVAPDGSQDALVVRTLRVPRTLLALAAGTALGLAGALAQGHTRNPVADPGLLGMSAGAAFAVVGSIRLLGVGSVAGTVWFALLGALVAGVVVLAVGGSRAAGRDGDGPVTLVLAGAALTALLGALTGALVLLDANTLDSYRFWVVGSVAGRGPDVLRAVLPFLAAGALLAVVNARALDGLALGEDVARGLGVDVRRARAAGLAAITLLTAGAVAACGPIGFVGLLAPHLARVGTGPVHRALVPVAGLVGGILLVLADVAGRVVAPPGELQAGVVAAVVGAPVLVALVRRRRLVPA